MTLFRLAFVVSLLLLLWLQSLFTTTVHRVDGNHHIFCYGWIAWAFHASFVALFLAFAGIAQRLLQERVVMWILLLCTPLICLAVFPQTLYERVEITATHLIHRREPPHTKYNCEIPLADLTSAVRTARETGSFSTYYAVGYDLTTTDGRQFELPSCTVVTAAHPTIDAVLEARGVPMQTIVVPRPPPR